MWRFSLALFMFTVADLLEVGWVGRGHAGIECQWKACLEEDFVFNIVI